MHVPTIQCNFTANQACCANASLCLYSYASHTVLPHHKATPHSKEITQADSIGTHAQPTPPPQSISTQELWAIHVSFIKHEHPYQKAHPSSLSSRLAEAAEPVASVVLPQCTATAVLLLLMTAERLLLELHMCDGTPVTHGLLLLLLLPMLQPWMSRVVVVGTACKIARMG